MLRVTAVLLSIATMLLAIACSAPAEESLASSDSALRVVGSDPPPVLTGPVVTGPVATVPPITTAPPVVIAHPRACTSTRLMVHHGAQTCFQQRDITVAGGHWSAEALFPDAADPAVRDHFCAYTWNPTSWPGCTDAKTITIERTFDVNADRWREVKQCPAGASCGEAAAASVTVPEVHQGAIPDTRHCQVMGDLIECIHPGGGGCDLCGVISHNTAILVDPDGVAGGAQEQKVRFEATAGGVVHQFEAVTTSPVFSVTLPVIDGVPYDDGPVGSLWDPAQPRPVLHF